MLEIGIILVLIFVNGLLAASEAAVVASRRPRLVEQVRAGLPGAPAALRAVEAPVRFLSTVQVGITLIGILSGVFGGAMLADDLAIWLGGIEAIRPIVRPLAFVLTVVTITYVSLVVGELVPKRIAMEHPETLARFSAPPMNVIAAITSPVVRFLTFSTNAIVGTLGIGSSTTETVSDEEIRSVIRLGAASGVLQEQERAVIERIFSLADRRAGSFMIPRRDVECVAPDAPPELVRELVRRSRATHYPVSPGGLDELQGVVALLDLAHSPGRTPGALKQPALFIPETANALQAIEVFREANAQLAFVTDEHGTIEGMIRLVDLVEDILGESGFSHDEPGIVRRRDGSYLIDGLLPLHEFLEAFDEAPSQDFDPALYHTVGGMVVHHLGRLASAGDVVGVGHWTFEVLDTDGRRVDKLCATMKNGTAGEHGSTPDA